MLLSLALILIIGFSLGGIFNHFRLPSLLGMILTGILIGPYAFDLISEEILNISGDLREIALIVILMRAGLTIDLKDLKKVGRPAILMSLLPATCEIIGFAIFAPLFFQISTLDAIIMGTVIAAVSPAVIVPRMIHLIESGIGKKKSIPQLIMAGASVDDIYVIILFTAFINFSSGGVFDFRTLVNVPVAITTGILVGALIGLGMVWFFKAKHIRDTIKVLILLSVSFILVTLETWLDPYMAFSGLIAVMTLGATLAKTYPVLTKRLTGKFSKIWVGAELLLFVLVGATVQISYIPDIGFSALILIFIALGLRVIGVAISLIGSNLNYKEKAFCAVSYLPKATVQAAIGAVPLSFGLKSGHLILTVAVLSILVTAPLGAILIDRLYSRCLE
jgi:NhaP-type Na+/H+ or K+/H+ antiporter